MEKLNVDALFPSETDYELAKNEYIADHKEYKTGGFFSFGSYEKSPEVARATWQKWYPNGFEDWREREAKVAYSDVKALGDKINEIIESLTSTSMN